MDGAHVVVFGDGEEAVRKIRLLEKTPVDVRQFADASVSGARDALKGAAFSIVAVADDDLADVAIAMVREAGVPLNAVDRPEHCDFTVPSILDRGDLVAAIGSGGAAPVLAKS
ncbi:MAG: NAD(P)-dependent oxidoreductase, partial [Pseudomonadota bacterium]